MARSKESTPVNHVNPIFLKIGIIVVVILIISVTILRFIQVPYQATETYHVIEEYTTQETYLENETQAVPVQVEKIEYYEEVVNVGVQQPLSGELPQSPSSYSGGTCKYENYNYTFEYIYATPLEYGVYDPITEIGYNKKDNMLRQGVEICNSEKKSLMVNFKICKWTGDVLADCIDRLQTRIRANSCEKRILQWITHFDEEKHMTLEPIEVSQKLVCLDSSGEYSTTSLYPALFGQDSLMRLTNENVRVLTKSGYYNPYNYYIDDPSSVFDSADVQITQKVPSVRTVIEYSEQDQEVEVEKLRDIPQTRVIERQRILTKYRSLFNDIVAKIMSP